MATMDKINDLYDKKQKIALGGGEDRINKQHSANKNTARERIQMLMDPNSFVEVDALSKLAVLSLTCKRRRLLVTALSQDMVQ